jgi:hypothetical protein
MAVVSTERRIINALIQYFETEKNFEEKLVSLYVKRTTGLSHQSIFNCFKRHGVEISLVHDHTYESIFSRYIEMVNRLMM